MAIWLACIAALLWSDAGCTYVSLACDTGPSEQGLWSVAELQDAHVGETLKFSLILRERLRAGRIAALGITDYASINILEERIEVRPNINSEFLFEHRPVGLEPGRVVTVRAAAFKVKGTKDYMKIRGTWHRSFSPIDEPDRLVGRGAIRLRGYQSRIEYAFLKPRVDLDWSSARLVITRRDGQVSTVFADQPHRPGFTMNGPDRSGYYHVRYLPLAEQVNKTGTTRAALKVLDVNGVQQTHDFEFDTP